MKIYNLSEFVEGPSTAEGGDVDDGGWGEGGWDEDDWGEDG